MTKKRPVVYAKLTEDQWIAEVQRLEGENRALIQERETARDWAVRLENENRRLEASVAELKALARSQMTRRKPDWALVKVRDLIEFYGDVPLTAKLREIEALLGPSNPDLTDFNVHLTIPTEAVALMQQLASQEVT